MSLLLIIVLQYWIHQNCTHSWELWHADRTHSKDNCRHQVSKICHNENKEPRHHTPADPGRKRPAARSCKTRR